MTKLAQIGAGCGACFQFSHPIRVGKQSLNSFESEPLQNQPSPSPEKTQSELNVAVRNNFPVLLRFVAFTCQRC